MVGPVRGALLVSGFGPGVLPWTYMAGAALTGVVVWVYGRFTCMPRGRLIGGCLAILAVTVLGGALLVSAAPSPALSFAYLLWTDVFGIMSVTLFWTYANDVFAPDEAKRWFGVIAGASPVGSIAGAYVVKTFVAEHGPAVMLVAAGAAFALVLPVFLLMERLAAAAGRGRVVDAPCDVAPPPPPMARTIAASPYLLFLTLIVGLERLVPDINNYLFGVQAAWAYAGDSRGMAVLYANVNWWSSLLSFAASLLLVGPTIRRLGVGAGLMIVGVVNLSLFAAYPLAPSLGLVSLFSGLDAVARYTWFKTSKETTYSLMQRDVIYRVKAFVEMFVYRLARGIGGFMLLFAAWWKGGGTGAALMGLPLAALWVYASWRVGREHARAEAVRA
ncbi:MAG: hypothetical protein HY923_09805 [Elusimicrobia bacterium]|nr:hypothetical protein [Elusimicrobiota bacterium]